MYRGFADNPGPSPSGSIGNAPKTSGLPLGSGDPKSGAATAEDVSLERTLRHDLKLLATFIGEYCSCRHRGTDKSEPWLKLCDIPAIYGKRLQLCDSCRRLLLHAFVMRIKCPFDPKPACKKCPEHCYAPVFRAQIREVMKVAGRRLVMRGRLDYLYHLFF